MKELKDVASQHGFGGGSIEKEDDGMTQHLHKLATAIAANESGNMVMEKKGTYLQDTKYGMVHIQQQLLALQQTQQQMAAAMKQIFSPTMMHMPMQQTPMQIRMT